MNMLALVPAWFWIALVTILALAGLVAGVAFARDRRYHPQHRWAHARQVVREVEAEGEELCACCGQPALGYARGPSNERLCHHEDRDCYHWVTIYGESGFRGSMSLDRKRAISPAGYLRGLDRVFASITTTSPPPAGPEDYDPELDEPWRWLPADPVPREDLQSDARIEAGLDWRDQTEAALSPEALETGTMIDGPGPCGWREILLSPEALDICPDCGSLPDTMCGAPSGELCRWRATDASPAPCPVCDGTQWRTVAAGRCWQCRDCGYVRGHAEDPGPGAVPETSPGPDAGEGQMRDYSVRPVGQDTPNAGITVCADPGHPPSLLPPTRLADTGDIYDAAALADATAFMRAMDADVAGWLEARAADWAQLELLGALT